MSTFAKRIVLLFMWSWYLASSAGATSHGTYARLEQFDYDNLWEHFKNLDFLESIKFVQDPLYNQAISQCLESAKILTQNIGDLYKMGEFDSFAIRATFPSPYECSISGNVSKETIELYKSWWRAEGLFEEFNSVFTQYYEK